MAFNEVSTPTETYELAFADHADPPAMHISYGLPFTKSCAKHVLETFKAHKVYIIASTSLSKQTDHIKSLERVLGARHAGTWTGVRPHTPWEDIVPIIIDMREKQADLLITVGGCSLTDGAKVIIYALANHVKTLADIHTLLKPSEADLNGTSKHLRDKTYIGNAPTIPIICIPTTLSASEYTRFGAGTDTQTHLKVIMTHPKMYPSIIIMAPELALTTPSRVWLSTGVRAIDHCVEGYCSTDSPLAYQRTAARSVSLLVANLLKSKDDPSNLEARLACHLAARGATMSLLYMPGQLLAGASHGIGHQLGPLGVGHGETSCILLPAVCRYNQPVNGAAQATLKSVIWDCDPTIRALFVDAGLDEHASDLADALDIVFRTLGMPRTLREVGVGRDSLDQLAENSLLDPCCVANPRPLGKQEVLEILEMVIE